MSEAIRFRKTGQRTLNVLGTQTTTEEFAGWRYPSVKTHQIGVKDTLYKYTDDEGIDYYLREPFTNNPPAREKVAAYITQVRAQKKELQDLLHNPDYPQLINLKGQAAEYEIRNRDPQHFSKLDNNEFLQKVFRGRRRSYVDPRFST